MIILFIETMQQAQWYKNQIRKVVAVRRTILKII